MTKLFVTISPNSPNLECLEVIEERAKSYKVRNADNGRWCFLPKSGLKPRKPGDESYADEFVLAGWFRSKLSIHQERALNIC